MTKKCKTVEKSKIDNLFMRFKVISCRVFVPELEIILKDAASGPDEIGIDWLPLRAHDQPDTLRNEIQLLIDAADAVGTYDAVLLAYGLCGNAVSGIRAGSIPLYIPRAHDCSHILLGGNTAHKKYFKENPSRGWTSRGYLEEEGDPFRSGGGENDWDFESLTLKYGEENACYIRDALHASDSSGDTVLYYLDVPETGSPEFLSKARERAEERGKHLEVIPATLTLLFRLLGGRGGDEILYVSPGAAIRPSWDNQIMNSEME